MKILLSILLVCSLFVAGCGNDNQSKSNNEENKVSTSNSQNNNANNSNSSEHKDKYDKGKPLDKSMPVTKAEMDKFIPTARSLKLTAEETKQLVQILKQCGVELKYLTDENSQRPNYFKNSNNVKSVTLTNPPDTPYLNSCHVTIDKGKTGLSVYLEMGDKDVVLYNNEVIWDDLSIVKKPSDEVYKRIDEYMKKDTKYGKIVKIDYLFAKRADEPIKDIVHYSYDKYIGGIVLTTRVIITVESKVYGGDNEQKHIDYIFNANGGCITSRDDKERVDVELNYRHSNKQ